MKWTKIILLVVTVSLAAPLIQPVQAQCPMCRMSAETNLKNGGRAGKGLNTGIMYMLIAPYACVMTLGTIWYLNRRKVLKAQEDGFKVIDA